MSSVGELSVDITADASRLRRELASITGSGGALSALPAAAGLAALAAGAAVAGFGAASVRVFADFDTGMREVFTLLPGITQEAMDDMEAEVIAFSNEFGKLPNEVIPALYQALSAGVPQENVFDFMRIATELSIGGVADLEVAVDALSSVVNAYGEEAITAQEASDILFTAVKEGKTTVDEIAGSIGRVAPIAADAGVGFDQVAAAIAAMTAQGLSTDEATTALRAMLLELTDGGSNVSEKFMQLTGQTFPQFIAAGGDLGEALRLVREDTDGMGMRMTDVFGNIRGGLAATVLSGQSGQEAFSSSLEEMGDSAGATRAAFETMDAGIQASWNRLTTGFNTLMVEVGDELAPMFQSAVDFIVTDIMPNLRDFVLGVFTAITTATEALTGVWTQYQTDSDGIFATVRGIVEAAGAAIGAAFDLMVAAWETVLKPAWEAIRPLVEVLWAAISTTIENSLAVITGVLNALAALLRGDFSGAWDAIESTISTVSDNTKAYVETAWNGIKTFLEGVFAGYVTAATDRWNEGKDAIETATNAVKTWLESTWNDIKDSLESVWGDVTGAATTAWEATRAAVEAPVTAVKTWLEETWEAIREWVKGLWEGIVEDAVLQWGRVKANIEEKIAGVKLWLEETWEAIREWLSSLWAGIGTKAGELWEGVDAEIRAPIQAAWDWLVATWEAIKAWLESLWNGFGGLAETAFGAVKSAIEGALGGLGDFLSGVFEGVVTTIGELIDGIVGRIRGAWESITELGGAVSSAVESATTTLTDARDTANTWFEERMPEWMQNLPGVRRDEPAMATGGIVTAPMRALIGEAGPEAIIPLDRLERMFDGGGAQTIIVELDGRAILRSMAPRMVDELRLRTGITP